MTRGATNLGINPPNLPTLKIVVLPIKVSSFTKGFLIAQLVKNLPAIQEDPGLIPGLGRCAVEGIGYLFQFSWASLVAQLVKNLPAVWETRVRSLSWEDPLENRKATHSSVLAWRISWTEEPGRLQSTGSQRVGHD